MEKRLQNKFNLTKEQNVFLARKTMAENIYFKGKFERLNTTFPQTETIVQGLSVSGIPTHEIQVILNMKNAWTFILDNIETGLNLDTLCDINSFVAYNESLDWGVLRTGKVGISGVKYQPEIPVKEKVMDDMYQIVTSKELSDTFKCIHFMLYSMRSQLFWDGNKRTAIIGANLLMIEKGLGLITITEEHFETFNELLSKFYETNDYSVIDEFVYDNCLFGIEFD